MHIAWYEPDQRFVVTLPEWGPYASAEGATYEEAVAHAVEVLEMLIEEAQKAGDQLPQPLLLVAADAAELEVAVEDHAA
jgi:predicted RNase H-like HicB family nuclease